MITVYPKKTATELADTLKTEGGQKKVWTSDDNMDIFSQMLRELKIIKIHIQSLSGEKITEGDL